MKSWMNSRDKLVLFNVGALTHPAGCVAENNPARK